MNIKYIRTSLAVSGLAAVCFFAKVTLYAAAEAAAIGKEGAAEAGKAATKQTLEQKAVTAAKEGAVESAKDTVKQEIKEAATKRAGNAKETAKETVTEAPKILRKKQARSGQRNRSGRRERGGQRRSRRDCQKAKARSSGIGGA